MNFNDLVAMGIHISLVGDDKIRCLVPPPYNTPELKQEIINHKPQLIEELKARLAKGGDVLDMWRRDAIPRWQGIFLQSIKDGNIKQKEYAEWMLWEVLLYGRT